MQSVSEAHSTYIEWGQSLDQGGCRGFSLCAPSPFPAPFRVVMSHPNPVPFGQVPVIVTLIDPRSGVERSRRRSKGKGRGTNIERSKQRERSEGGPERMLGKPSLLSTWKEVTSEASLLERSDERPSLLSLWKEVTREASLLRPLAQAPSLVSSGQRPISASRL